jgi:acetamidase/formamidase
MSEHFLASIPRNIHWGYYWAGQQPVLTIDSGDTVTIDTVSHEGILPDQGSPVEFFARFGLGPEQVLDDLKEVHAKATMSGPGPHVLTGPIYVNGAEPGDVLEVRILDLIPRVPYGVNAIRTGKGALPEEFTLNTYRLIPLDLARRVAVFSAGDGGKPRVEIPFKLHMGSMGLASPAHMGRVNSAPPDVFGGNIDLNELGPGSTLYLPVHVAGGLFSTGDGHAAMGCGEVSLTGVETSLTGKFQFIVRKDMTLARPLAETAANYYFFGFSPSLDDAMRTALREVIGFLVAHKGFTRTEALQLASCAVDFVVTQVVDGNKGIHGVLPKALFKD